MISAFLEHNLICLCQSPYNTPILPVQKPGTHEYHFVQDLRAINQIAEDIHLVVANPYTLQLYPGISAGPMVSDLQGTFYCTPLSPKSQDFLLLNGMTQRPNWNSSFAGSCFPPGFKNAPTTFRKALAKELMDLQLYEGTLLQYVDDVLIARETKDLPRAFETWFSHLQPGWPWASSLASPFLHFIFRKMWVRVSTSKGCLQDSVSNTYKKHSE